MDIMSVSDAVAVLDYLHKRELLCDRCGGALAVYVNANSSRCATCKAPNAEYGKAKIPNELERRIVIALQRWIERNPPGGTTNDPMSGV